MQHSSFAAFSKFFKRIASAKTLWLQEKNYQILSHKDPWLSSSVFPCCHLHLAVNLRWTCQLSSLITDRPTCFPANSPPSTGQREPSIRPSTPLVSSLAPVRIRKHLEEPEEFVWAASTVPSCVRGNVQACAVFVMVERTQRGTIECDGMWQSYRGARSDCEQLRGCESNGEKGSSHSCHPHTGDCQEMEICQIMFHDFGAHNELWIELWARRDGSDVRAPENGETGYGNGNRLVQTFCASFDSCKQAKTILQSAVGS